MTRRRAFVSKRVLFAFLAVGMLLVCAAPSSAATVTLRYGLLDVQTVYSLMMHSREQRLLVVDVRSECEYKLNHLYAAISIPFSNLQSQIEEMNISLDQKIIVYCRTGYTSQLAAEILVIHGFSDVSTMVGGILAWAEAGYPMWTASHFVSVGPGSSLGVEPLITYLAETPQPATGSNGCLGCALSGFNATRDYSSIVLEDDGIRKVENVTIHLNGTTFQSIMTTMHILSLTESTDGVNRSLSFSSVDFVSSFGSLYTYRLLYFESEARYNLTLSTMLASSVPANYNRSVTSVELKAVGDLTTTSLEMIYFSASPRLSEMYRDIARVAAKLGREYSRSGDPCLNILGARYSIVDAAIEYLSKQVGHLLRSYDRSVETALTIMSDDCSFGCLASAWGSCYGCYDPVTIGCIVVAIMGCLAWGPFYPACVGPLLTFCGYLDFAFAMGCVIWAVYLCCFIPPPPPPPGGGGCPILTALTGAGYTEEGLLDIHSDHDIIRAYHLNAQAVPSGDRFLMRLTEHHQTISHINQVRLFARVSNGELVELPLVGATHIENGDVLQALLYSDNLSVVELGADHNNGTSQYIDLEFLALGLVGVKLIIVLEGYNSIPKE